MRQQRTTFSFCNKTPIDSSRMYSTKQLKEKGTIRQTFILPITNRNEQNKKPAK